VYVHHHFLDAANEITARCNAAKNKAASWSALENNPGDNDYKRWAANYCMEHNKPLKDLVQNFVYLVKAEGCCGEGAFPCSGNGAEFSITLLVALVDAMRQRDHTDYDPMYFKVYEDFEDLIFADYDGGEEYRHTELETSCDEFNGASLFVNFSWNKDQRLDIDQINVETGEYEFISLPFMSIMVITGDLVHAGSANQTGSVTRKFFLYLDPRRDCRNQGVFMEGQDEERDNFIYFGNSRRAMKTK
jgi:hypothetical protein